MQFSPLYHKNYFIEFWLKTRLQQYIVASCFEYYFVSINALAKNSTWRELIFSYSILIFIDSINQLGLV